MVAHDVKAARENAAGLMMMRSVGTPNDIMAQATKAKLAKLTGTK
jgi:hypothetical protein